jgi:ribosomal protein S18 acetylase RimI-like enzyme
MHRVVRAASSADREAILGVCTAAFVTEPAFAHFFNSDYEPHARTFLDYLLEVRLAGGIVWVEEVDGCIAAVSMWDPPGGATVPQAVQNEMWATTTSTFPSDSASRLDRYHEQVHAFEPPGKHYYLGIIASHPELRGRGHGEAVLRPGLIAADAQGNDTFLETGTESNLTYYARFGFDVTATLDLEDGTRIWCLTRPPGASLG